MQTVVRDLKIYRVERLTVKTKCVQLLYAVQLLYTDAGQSPCHISPYWLKRSPLLQDKLMMIMNMHDDDNYCMLTITLLS